MHHRGTEIELLSKNGPPKPEYLVEPAASISGGLAPSQRKWQTAHLIGKPELRPRAVKGTRMMTRWRSHTGYAARRMGMQAGVPPDRHLRAPGKAEGKGPEVRISNSRFGFKTRACDTHFLEKQSQQVIENKRRVPESDKTIPITLAGLKALAPKVWLLSEASPRNG